jgi:hypothetical protein
MMLQCKGRSGDRLLAGLAVGLLVVAGAEATADPDTGIDARARSEVVSGLAELIESEYVDLEVGRRVATQLKERLEAGDFEPYETARGLASALTQVLQPTDRHFFVDWQPPGSDTPPPGSHSEEAQAQWLALSRLQNFGFRRVEILPGNVGYLDLRFFDDVAHAAETAIAAMNLLANADAVIVDLRQNGGGEPNMVQLLVSYFLKGGVHYNSLCWRKGDRLDQLWTLPHVQGRRLLDTPLFVLTSARTGSAAEGFGYALQAQGRATLVGQPTAGAAHPGEGFPIGRGFSVFISTGKAVNPVTGTSWEGTGVKPDVEVPTPHALAVAHGAALRRLLPDAAPEARMGLEWALEAVDLQVAPIELTASDLEPYAGTYGDRKIRLESDHLTYQRATRAVYPMAPLGDDRFLVLGLDDFRLEFVREDTGRISHLHDKWSDGHVEANLRQVVQ